MSTVKSPDVVAYANRRREEGALLREIATECGVAKTTVNAWLKDPDLSKQRARRESYGGRCKVCGGATDGSRGPKATAKTCMDCLRWTPEACIAAVIAFFNENHRSPTTSDAAVNSGLPHENSSSRLFGNWNGLLLEADLPLNMDRRPETQQEVELMLRAGMTAWDVADQFGWTVGNVHLRLRTRGMTVYDLNPNHPRGQSIQSDMRDRIRETYAETHSFAETARRVGVSWSTAKKYALGEVAHEPSRSA